MKKGRWFKEKQLGPHWGEQTCSLAFKIQAFPCPVTGRSLGLLPNFKNISISEALCKLMQTWMFWTFCLFSVELASQKMVGKLPKLSNIYAANFDNFLFPEELNSKLFFIFQHTVSDLIILCKNILYVLLF